MEMSRPSRRGIATAHVHDGSAIYPGSPHERGAEDLACKSIAGSYAAEIAAREMGGLSLADALMLCELLAKVDPLDPGSPLCESCELPASADYATADLTFSIAPLSAASPPPAASATDCATSTTSSR